MQQQKQQPGADDGHPYRTREGHEQDRQQADLQHSGGRKVRGRPFADVGEAAHPQQLQGEQQRLDPLGRQHRHGRGGEPEPAPPQDYGAPAFRRRGQQRFQCERSDQRQAEHEAAMQVRPERHERQRGPARRPLLRPGADQFGGPDLHDRQRQQVRPRQQAAAAHQQSERQEADERKPVDPSAEVARQQPCGQAGRRRGQQHHAAPAAAVERAAQEDLGQPLVGMPGRAGDGVGERIGVQHRAPRDHQLAGGHMPPGVRVVQDLGGKRRQEDQQPGDRRRHAADGQVRSQHAQLPVASIRTLRRQSIGQAS